LSCLSRLSRLSRASLGERSLGERSLGERNLGEPTEGTPEDARLPAPLPARRAYRPEGRAYSSERRTVISAVRFRRIRKISWVEMPGINLAL
jgi:hypothetical protein